MKVSAKSFDKHDFIDFLVEKKILKFGDFILKSGRRAPFFLNFGEVCDGGSLSTLGNFYANEVSKLDIEEIKGSTTFLMGPSYKGIPIAVSTAISLAEYEGMEFPYSFDRKEEKLHGEVSDKASLAKKLFVGYIPKEGDRAILLDDVVTTGETKKEEVDKLKALGVKCIELITSVDREELDENANDPAISLESKIGLSPKSIIGFISDAVPYLVDKGIINGKTKQKILAYSRAFGIERVKGWCREQRLIEKLDKGIIVSCDAPIDISERAIKATAKILEVVAYKFGFESLIGGLDKWVSLARKYTDKPIIYDHQKAGTDIPDTGRRFMEIIKQAGADAVIIFPQSGPATQWEWIYSAFEQDLEVLAGGGMTHTKYKRSEGGYIADDALLEMYALSAKAGVNNFIVPGNKVEDIAVYKKVIENTVSGIKASFFSLGLVTQGGEISEAAKVAGDRWYPILGRAIYGDVNRIGRYHDADEMSSAAYRYSSRVKAFK